MSGEKTNEYFKYIHNAQSSYDAMDRKEDEFDPAFEAIQDRINVGYIARATALLSGNKADLFSKKNSDDLVMGAQCYLNGAKFWIKYENNSKNVISFPDYTIVKPDPDRARDFIDEIVRRILTGELKESEMKEMLSKTDTRASKEIYSALSEEIARRISLPAENPLSMSASRFHSSKEYSTELKKQVWQKQVANTIVSECDKKINKLRKSFVNKAVDSRDANYVPTNVKITFTVPAPQLNKDQNKVENGRVKFVQGQPSDEKIGVSIEIDGQKKKIEELTSQQHKEILENPYTKGLMERLAKENACSDIKKAFQDNNQDPEAARTAVQKVLSAPPVYSKTDANNNKVNKTNANVLKEHRGGFYKFLESVFKGIGKGIEAIKEGVKETFGQAPKVSQIQKERPSNVIKTKSEELLDTLNKVTPTPVLRRG